MLAYSYHETSEEHQWENFNKHNAWSHFNVAVGKGKLCLFYNVLTDNYPT